MQFADFRNHSHTNITPVIFSLSLSHFLNIYLFLVLNAKTFYVYCMKVSEARNLERDTVESGLTFAGFAVHHFIYLLTFLISSYGEA